MHCRIEKAIQDERELLSRIFVSDKEGDRQFALLPPHRLAVHWELGFGEGSVGAESLEGCSQRQVVIRWSSSSLVRHRRSSKDSSKSNSERIDASREEIVGIGESIGDEMGKTHGGRHETATSEDVACRGGRVDDPSRGSAHQLQFCSTEVDAREEAEKL